MAYEQRDYYDGLSGHAPLSGNHNSAAYQDGKRLREIQQNADYSFESFQNFSVNVLCLLALVVMAAIAAAAWKAAEPAIAEWTRMTARFIPYWAFGLGMWAATASGENAARILFTLALISVELLAFAHLNVAAIALSAGLLGVVWFRPLRAPCPDLAVRLTAFAAVAAVTAATGAGGRLTAASYGFILGLHLVGSSIGLWLTAAGRATPTATKAMTAAAAAAALAMRFVLL